MILRTSIKVFAIFLIGIIVASIVVVAEAHAAKKRVTLKRLVPRQSEAVVLNKPTSAWQNEEAALSQTTLDDLYTAEVVNSIETRRGAVEQFEQKEESPYRHARPWEVNEYNSGRKEVAAWTAREVLTTRLKTILNGADKSSGGMKAVSTMKNLMGAEEKASEPASKSKTGAKGSAKAEPYFVANQKEEAPAIPTRLKTRLNVVKGRGEVRFTNPIVSTSLNVDASSRASDNVAVRMEKNLSALELKSHVDYGLDKKVLSVNLTKNITDEITANLSSRHKTSGASLDGGPRSEEALNMSYSVNF